jgi:hypothetical protein
MMPRLCTWRDAREIIIPQGRLSWLVVAKKKRDWEWERAGRGDKVGFMNLGVMMKTVEGVRANAEGRGKDWLLGWRLGLERGYSLN